MGIEDEDDDEGENDSWGCSKASYCYSLGWFCVA
jgi:hypothetical protein